MIVKKKLNLLSPSTVSQYTVDTKRTVPDVNTDNSRKTAEISTMDRDNDQQEDVELSVM